MHDIDSTEGRKNLKKEIHNRIDSGESKKALFDEYLNKYKSESETYLATIIAKYPTIEKREKIKSTNTVLLFLISFFATVETLSNIYLTSRMVTQDMNILTVGTIYILSLLVPLFAFYLTYYVKLYDGSVYHVIGIFGLLGFVGNIITIIFMEHTDTTLLQKIETISWAMIFLSGAVIAFYLKRKYFYHLTLSGPKRDEKDEYLLN